MRTGKFTISSFFGCARICAMSGSMLISFIAFSIWRVAISNRFPRSLRLTSVFTTGGVTDQELATIVAEGGRLRALVLELWQRTRMDWGFVTDRLSVAFRKEKWLGASERRFVGETLYGLVRHLRRVDL